ncbi:MAG: SRPBCC family protein [Gammaproteobacteria bacterium]|nr:SRPBCC family protein [Gammaproteobacteria bacterium]
MAVKFFSFLAVVFISLLLIGLILPGTWAVERSLEMPAVPEQVFAYVNDVSLWDAWTDWPEAAGERIGPSRGVGAGRSWDDPEFGDGVFTIVESVAGERVRYRVEVEDGAMITEGTIALDRLEDGTRVTWRETGDFGWNPILGYVARAMDRLQGREMELGLERLREASTP